MSNRRSAGSRDARIRRVLLAWYARNRRDLPWRRSRDPWAIWLSEVMLQQTRVDTVIPYYERFLKRYPTVADMARGSLDDVLAGWAGLGYYSRARNLHAASQEIVREHGGRVPKETKAFRALPGVGDYTAGAVLSIAYGLPLPAVDGNVRRLFARLDDLAAPTVAGLRDRAAELVPAKNAGDWTQALMELGALVCTPAAPKCGECPVSGECRALDRGTVGERPPTVRRGPVRSRRLLALWDETAAGVRLERRAGPGIWRGLWMVPMLPWGGRSSELSDLEERLAQAGFGILGEGRRGPQLVHMLTHRRLELTLVFVRWQPSSAKRQGLERVAVGGEPDRGVPAALGSLARLVRGIPGDARV